ncbi:MAG: hypothetical protein JXB38_01390 [Anaerolineales bacterium]|nr:hypothetical protein [Anaerolineales bacterium]
MKRAVSVSIGSTVRDKSVEVELLGEKVHIERIGTNGDMEKAAQLYKELDGKVDAFGVGGADLGVTVDGKWYPLHSVSPMVRFVKQTPLVDGAGLKNTLERMIVPQLEAQIGDYLQEKRVLITSGADRWGMAMSFVNGGYEYVFGDLMFGLGLPIPVRKVSTMKVVAAIIMPLVGRLPFDWVYPTGEKQLVRVPKFEKYYAWANVVAGDCLFVQRHMPDDMEGKVVVTNTTTERDVELFRSLGVKYLMTTTPVLDGRSFGTNMMEAALIAVSGKGRPLTAEELTALVKELHFEPKIQELN